MSLARRMNRRDLLKGGAVGLVGVTGLALLGSACSPATPPQVADTQVNSGSTASKPGGSIVVAWGLDPRGFDPAIGDARPEQNLNMHVYDSLVALDSQNKVVPALAESWTNPSPLTWRFTLRQGIRFHNGDPFDAEAVKFNIDRFVDPNTKATIAGYFRQFDKATVVNANTIDLALTAPAPLFLKYLAAYLYVAAPKTIDSSMTNPVGTGAFRFGEWTKGDHITLEANSGYWGAPAKLGKLTFKTLPQPTSRVAALKTGEADVVVDLDPTAAKELQGASDLKVASVPGYRNIYLLVDHRADTPLKNRDVRLALNYAIDKDALINGILEGYGTPLEGQPYSPMYFGYNPAIKRIPYDLAQAKKLLADAGQGNGFEVKFVTPFGRYLKDKELTEAIAGQLDKVGVKANIEVVEWAAAMQKYTSHTNGPLAMNGQASPSLDCLEHFAIYWWSKGAVSHYDNPSFDAIFERASVEMDDKTREKLLQDGVKLLADDAANIWLHQQHDVFGFRNRVQNWTPPNNQLLDFHTASAV